MVHLSPERAGPDKLKGARSLITHTLWSLKGLQNDCVFDEANPVVDEPVEEILINGCPSTLGLQTPRSLLLYIAYLRAVFLLFSSFSLVFPLWVVLTPFRCLLIQNDIHLFEKKTNTSCMCIYLFIKTQ